MILPHCIHQDVNSALRIELDSGSIINIIQVNLLTKFLLAITIILEVDLGVHRLADESEAPAYLQLRLRLPV